MKTYGNRYIRTPQERQSDLAEISKLYLRGYSQQEISQRMAKKRHYPFSQRLVIEDIRVINKMWRESALVDFNTAKAKELTRIDALEAAAWEGWESSRKTKKTTTTEDTSFTQTNNTMTNKKSSRKKESRDGTVVFLEQVRKCIEMRCKILGLFSPQQVAVVDWRQKAIEAGIPESEAVKEFETLVQRFTESLERAELDGSDGDSSNAGSLE